MQNIQIIFSNIIYMAVMATLVAGIILLLRKVFDQKISPKWKFAMWGLLLISLIIPFRITLYANNDNFYTVSSIVDWIDKAKRILSVSQYGKIATVIWISGILILWGIYTVNSRRIKRKIGKKEVKEERILKLFQEAKNELEIRKEIKLVEQKERITPCIYGMIHPQILVTQDILKKSDEVIKHILMHELAHYKKKDIWLNKFLLVITSIYWFNPVIWFCFKQIRQDMELKADELVLSKLPKQNEKEYAKSLVTILPISQEEKMTTRLLYVTDGKKNMERRIKMIKLAKQFKEYKTLIGVTTTILTLCLGILLFTQIKPKEEQETFNQVKYFETPDRIVYKVKEQDRYYVYTAAKTDYNKLLNQLTKCIDGVGEGARVSQEEIKKIEQEENYIELDYDTISKNYLIAYQKENYNVIKRTDEGGVVVRNNIKQKEKLEKLLKKQIKEKAEVYQMADNKEYKVPEPISYEVPTWSNELKKYEPGTYSVRLGNKQAWERFKENNQIAMSQEITEEQFEKTNVIATITKYQIEKIETRIGGATLYFAGEEEPNQYYINIYCMSKAVNSNCIYRNFNNIKVTKNIIKREELKKETLEAEEVSMSIKNLSQKGNNIILTGEITEYYSEYEQVNFEVEVIVDKDTQIFSNTKNQWEELQKMKERGDNIFVTFRKTEKQQGKLVAQNIEVMGC
ncbi:MAG: M56 family metallopeptidase [Clostridia bacterium]|nr:M56 family metallopeptidase [Clostridia bacterium]